MNTATGTPTFQQWQPTTGPAPGKWRSRGGEEGAAVPAACSREKALAGGIYARENVFNGINMRC